MPDKSFDVVININSRAEGVAASQAMIADLRANIDQANVSAAQGNATFEQQAAIQGEINAMIGIRRDLLEAQLTGNTAAVQLARDELAVHSQTLATLRSEALSQEAINGLISEQSNLLQVANTNRIKASVEAAAAEQARLSAQLEADAAAAQNANQRAAIEAQSISIAEARLGITQAQLAGDDARIAALRTELEIRSSILGVLRAETLTAAEIDALLEKQAFLLAQAATSTGETAGFSLLAGSNLNKARGEALVLGRELATGSFNARTLGAFLGALGPTLTVAAIAGFGLYEILKRSHEEAAKEEQTLHKIYEDLFKARLEMEALASTSSDFGDILKIGEKAIPSLEELQRKIDNLKPPAAFSKMLDDVKQSLSAGPLLGYHFETSDEAFQKIKNDLEAAKQEAFDTANNEIEAGRATELWRQQLEELPVDSAIGEANRRLQELIERQDEVNRWNSLPDLIQWIALGKQIESVKKLVGELIKTQDRQVQQARTSEIRNLLREEELILQRIRGEQEVISRNSYLSAETQRDQLHNLALREQAQILIEIGKIEAEIAKLRLIGDEKSQEQITQLTQKLQALQTQFQLLGFTIRETTASGEFTADLSRWVNSWGTASHQIAQTIEGTINAALQGTNQLLLDSAFHTSDWRQTLMGAERQVLNLFLTMGEQMILQNTLGKSLQASSTAQTVASGGAIAAAHAPAAAATSISSYGTAAIVGEALAIAAIAAIIAALSGGFKKGGFTGHKDEDSIAGVVHGGEYVFTADEVEALGIPFLQQLASAAGGRAVVTGSPGAGTSGGLLTLATTPQSLMQQKFGRGPAIAGYQDGGWVEPPSTYAPGGGPAGGTYVWGRTADGFVTPVWVPSGTGYAEIIGMPGPHGEPIVQIFRDPFSGASGSGLIYPSGDGSGAGLAPGSLGGRSLAVIDFWNATAQYGQFGIDWAYDANGDPQPMSYFDATGQTPSAGPLSGSGVGSGGVNVGASDSGPSGALIPGWIRGLVGQLGLGMTGSGRVGGGLTSAQIGAFHAYSAAIAFALGTVAPGPPRWEPGRLVVEGPDFSDAAIGVTRGKFGAATMPSIWRGHASGSVFSGGPGISQKQLKLGFTPFGPTGASVPGGASAAEILAATPPDVLAALIAGATGNAGAPADLLTDLRMHSGGPVREVPILAEVGEHMIQRRAAEYYGHHTLDLINHMRIPVERFRFHDGGEINPADLVSDFASPSSSSSSRGPGWSPTRMPPIIIHLHTDELHTAIRKFHEDPSGRKVFVSTMKKNS